MKTDDLFHSPNRRIAGFAEMQVHLYRQDIRLQDYFMQLQKDMLMGSRALSEGRRAPNSKAEWAIRLADRVSQIHRPQKIKTDVLVCPIQYFERKTENRFLIRTILGLAQTGAEILCLLPANASCRNELDSQLASSGLLKQVRFLDPTLPFSPIEARIRRRVALIRGREAFEDAEQILAPHGLGPSDGAISGFEHTADFVEAWERMSPWIEFDAVVARCHWHTLCSPVCRTGLQRGKPVITFQQGVIGHTLDVPVTATKFVAFGKSSATFLPKVNRRFFEAVETLEPPVEFIQGGSFVDTIGVLEDSFELKTVLMVDLQVDPGDFYGVGGQFEALLRLAEKLLAADLPLRRLIIRPHPYWSDLEIDFVQNIARQHPAQCEISHPAWSLEDDLRRSSVAIGIFSGALTIASAHGLPTYFLKTEGGYLTEDLGCFFTRQTVLPEDAFREVSKMLTDHQCYAEGRRIALENAREYYANGSNLNFSASFFERLLQNDSVTSQPRPNLQ